MKQAIIFGVVLGLIRIVGIYLSLNCMANEMLFGLSYLVVFLTFAVVLVFFLRKGEDRTMHDFGYLLKKIMTLALVGLVISTAFSGIYKMTMSAEKQQSYIEHGVETQVKMYESMGLDSDMVDHLEDELDSNKELLDMTFSPVTILFEFFASFLWYWIIALIPAGLMRYKSRN